MSGYVLIHRSLLGHPAFRNESEVMAFAWLIAKAAWRPTRLRYKGRSIDLKRGQLAISVRDFADAHERNKNWVSRLLEKMKVEGMIETHAGTGVLVITICNYDEYQATSELPETLDGTAQRTQVGTRVGTQVGTAAGQRRDTEQRREKDNKTTRTRVKHPIPDDFEPAEFGADTQSRQIVDGWSRTEFDRQVEKFRAHHQAAGSRWADWQAAWKTWVLNSVNFAARVRQMDDRSGKDFDLVEQINANPERWRGSG